MAGGVRCRSTPERGWEGSPCKFPAGISGTCHIRRQTNRGTPSLSCQANASTGPTTVPVESTRPALRSCEADAKPGGDTRYPAAAWRNRAGAGLRSVLPGPPRRHPVASEAVGGQTGDHGM